MDNALQELVEFVKSASPVIWEIFIKQVYVHALSLLLWASGMILVAVFLVRVGKWATKENPYGDWDFWIGLSYVFAFVFGFGAFACLIQAIACIINPEFYAIRFLLSNLGG